MIFNNSIRVTEQHVNKTQGISMIFNNSIRVTENNVNKTYGIVTLSGMTLLVGSSAGIIGFHTRPLEFPMEFQGFCCRPSA